MTNRLKWTFAIGTTSIVPGTKRTRHYLIFDIDYHDITPSLEYVLSDLGVTSLYIQATQRGWHVYTPLELTFPELLFALRRIPNVDQQWVNIGQQRRYFYLADKDIIKLPWPVVRMVLHG